MAQRKQSGLDLMASLPWPVGVVCGVLGYLAFRYGIGWYLGAGHDPVLSGVGKAAAGGIYAPLGWMLLVGCWIAAVASFISRRRRRQLLDGQTGIESIRQMHWREFEMLTGEAFRRQGYAVEETGLGGADGGIDLKLRRDGKTTLVQCKQWRNRQVSVNVVREMFGLLIDQRADAVKIVALGHFTPDARRFAQGKAIELIHGDQLIATVRTLQTRKAQTTKPTDNPLALSASMAASLLLIAVLSKTSASTPPPVTAAPIAAQVVPQPELPPAPALPATPAPHARAVIYASDTQNDADQREWKRKNAESMKILEKTTREMPLR